MDKYVVELHGVKIKVSVVDNATLINENASQLRASLDTAKPVVGLDIKTITYGSNTTASMMLVCAEGHCLIIPKLYNLHRYYSGRPHSELDLLLADRNICFLGMELERKRSICTRGLPSQMSNTGVDLGHFAARILKKPNLETAKLPELAAEVGIDVKPLSGTYCPQWDGRVFSEEGIKHAIHDVYTCYLIGKKLLGQI